MISAGTEYGSNHGRWRLMHLNISRKSGNCPAIESAHAVAYAMKLAPQMDKDQIMVINISGRGDKDVAAIARYRGGSSRVI